jgi:PDZ domain-containing protein
LKKPPGVTGESAGLADALVFLDHLSNGDLTAGLTVASTAVITLDGSLTPVGSVAVKTEAAVSARADVLFIHPENLSVARYMLRASKSRSPELVAVSHLSEAVSWLCDNGATTGELCNSLQR